LRSDKHMCLIKIMITCCYLSFKWFHENEVAGIGSF
jgi:hypothetical protein